jgi:hypothetical protein
LPIVDMSALSFFAFAASFIHASIGFVPAASIPASSMHAP